MAAASRASSDAAAAVQAVRDGSESLRSAAAKYNLSYSAIRRRSLGLVDVNAKWGGATVLSCEEETELVKLLIWAGQRHLGIGRRELCEGVRTLCNTDNRPVPWDRAKGPGQAWIEGFFKRNPQLATRSSRIYEANRVTADEQARMVDFYNGWKAFIDRLQPAPDHIWNTDETGACLASLNAQLQLGQSLNDLRF